MRRFGRKLDVERLRAALPLSAFFFDVLRHDGETLVDRPARERFAALAEALPSGLVVPRLVTSDAADAEAFYAEALRRGHEGVMAKAVDAPYEAGSRGASWLKVKRTHTLDLVVLAAEWGHGRRRGWLSNLHLGARDPAGGFVMLGKTFKGMTDEMLEWQTRELAARAIARDDYTVHVRPELVVGDRVQRPAGEPAVSGRPRAAVRPRQGLPTGQARRRGRHDRHGARALRRADGEGVRRMTDRACTRSSLGRCGGRRLPLQSRAGDLVWADDPVTRTRQPGGGRYAQQSSGGGPGTGKCRAWWASGSADGYAARVANAC